MFSSLLLGKSKFCLWFLLMRERETDDKNLMPHWVMCKITEHTSTLQQTNINTFPQQKWFYKQCFSRELFSSGCWSLSEGKLNKSTNITRITVTHDMTALHPLTFSFYPATNMKWASSSYNHTMRNNNLSHCEGSHSYAPNTVSMQGKDKQHSSCPDTFEDKFQPWLIQ